MTIVSKATDFFQNEYVVPNFQLLSHRKVQQSRGCSTRSAWWPKCTTRTTCGQKNHTQKPDTTVTLYSDMLIDSICVRSPATYSTRYRCGWIGLRVLQAFSLIGRPLLLLHGELTRHHLHPLWFNVSSLFMMDPLVPAHLGWRHRDEIAPRYSRFLSACHRVHPWNHRAC